MASFEQTGDEADEDTQEMDTGSPFSDMGLPGNGRADEGSCSCGGTVPLDDTLPLGEEEMEELETQLLGGALNLDGETQLLDDPEHAVTDLSPGANDNPFRTQPLDEYEETEVAGDDDEGTERTMLLSDEGGLSDDAATPCGVRSDDGRGETEDRLEMGTCTLPPMPRLSEPDKGEFPVAFEASTNDEGGSGPVRRRSFTEVRAAALRASGLAAACSTTPRTVDAEQIPSFCNSPSREVQDDISVSDHNVGMSEKCAGLTKNREQFVDIRAGVLNFDLGIMNSDKCMQNGHMEEITNKSGNLTVRKLTFEEAISGKDESTGKMMDKGKSDNPHSLVCNHSVAGLSYVGSQEPGEHSQADALDAIDKFLSINDVGLSQEVNPGKPCGVKTPPVSTAKGAHCLAKMGGRSSPVGKAGIFDWVDILEDEGGGDFFSKRKDFFFGNSEHLKKSRTNPPKSRHCDSRLAWDAFDKIGKHEGTNPETDLKTMGLTSSESRLKQHNSISGKLCASQVKTNRILWKEIAGQSSEEPTLQQLQKSHVGRGEENVYDTGPDTQMAAEAMEALVCGDFADHEPQNSHRDRGNMVGSPNMRARKKKASSWCISLKKRGTSASDIGGSIRRSKRIKMLHVEANLYSSNSSKESLNSSKLKRNMRKKAKMDSENGKTEKLLCTLKSTKLKLLDGNSSESFRTEKVHGKSGRSSTSVKVDDVGKQAFKTHGMEMDDVVKQVEPVSNEVDGCASISVLNDKISFSKEPVKRENNLNVTPIAHRTRKHKVYTMESFGTLSTYEETTKDLVEVKTFPAKRKQGRIVADAPEQLLDQGKDSNQVEHDKNISSEFDVQKIATLPEKQCESNALLGDTLGHKKRRTTRKSKSRNTHQAVNSKDPSMLRQVLPEAITPCPIQQDNSTVVVNANVSPRSVKNKSKRDAAFLPSETDMVHSGVKGAFVASGVRTRSFIKSHPYTSERGSSQGFKDGIKTGAGSSNVTHFTTNMNEKVHLQEVEPADSISFACFPVKHDVQSLSDVQDAQGNAKLKGTPKERVQLSGSTSIAPQKQNTVSPVCTSVDPLRASQKKGLSKSLVARELIRIDSMEVTSILGSKDLRRRRAITSICVCLSHHLDDDIIKHQKKILARLGVSIVASVSDATHFIADKFVRTRNMLEAMAVGKPVVTHLWLESCGQASCFIDEKNYILRDARKEKEIGFSMPASLARARQRPLLQGKRLFITTNVKPDRELVADLVWAAQGQPMERLGRSAIKDDKVPDDLLVISCEEDFAICIPLLEKGAEVFSSELLLNGIVIQKLEYERHRLFLDHVKRTRSTIWLRNENSNRFLPVTKCT